MSTRTTTQSNAKKVIPNKNKTRGETSEDNLTKDEKLLKRAQNAAPRSYVKKVSTSDLYSISKPKTTGTKTEKKAIEKKVITKHNTKDNLKSSPSTVSQTSVKTNKSVESKKESAINKSNALKAVHNKNSKTIITPRPDKVPPFVNVTVNSPPSKRKILERATKKIENTDIKTKIANESNKRLRNKTRTLTENEVKVLTPDTIDNNSEMQNLNLKLKAKPKAFFIDLDKSQKSTSKEVASDEKSYNYEDDFESYESDFDSYHSDNKTSESEKSIDLNTSDNGEDLINDGENHNLIHDNNEKKVNQNLDEERMLDSGNFELRESQKIATNKIKNNLMDNIAEDFEDQNDDHKNKSSLTDEGFLEMSSSSGVSSMKALNHTEVLDRPLFMDFKTSKENKKKRMINEQLKQRAKDVLSMITLHEMSYTLFEMKPIPYEVYMATFGKANNVQTAVQTYDDGIDEGVQTDEVYLENKWTQNPIQFSKDEIYHNDCNILRKNTRSMEDLLSKFTKILHDKAPYEQDTEVDSDYKNNPLRIYFEQKDGVGNGSMLPYKNYKSKLNNTEYSVDRLKRFLTKVENRVIRVLNRNYGNEINDFNKPTKYSFSEGYKYLDINENNTLLKHRKIANVVFSDTKSNLMMTVHNKGNGAVKYKCLVCLWDIVCTKAPLKILVAIENVKLSKFRGSTDGIFVGVLEDGSIHLWDLSEEPTWRELKTKTEKDIEDVKGDISSKTQTELDREWNVKNRDVIHDEYFEEIWRASAYTSSAFCLQEDYCKDDIVGLDFTSQQGTVNQDGGRKAVGQICSLQRKGVLFIWAIVHDKNNEINSDVGKAYWSKIRLEKIQMILLTEYIDVPIDNSAGDANFNLVLAKKRITNKRQEKEMVKNRAKKSNRPSSSSSVANTTKEKSAMLPDEKLLADNWELGIVCNDLKVLPCDKLNYYLIAKNCGDILVCTRTIGNFKVNTLKISSDSTSVTTLKTLPNNTLFLAGTNFGVVHLCSVLEGRVLLSLDCRSEPRGLQERVVADDKGRYVGSVPARNEAAIFEDHGQLEIESIQWSSANPCRIFTLTQDGVVSQWDLLQSDLRPRCQYSANVKAIELSDDVRESFMATLTENEVQLHLLATREKTSSDLNKMLFQKYISLL